MQLWKKVFSLEVSDLLEIGKNAIFKINGDSSISIVTMNYTASLVTQPIFTAARKYKVKSITGRVRVAGTGGACTISFYKAPSGTAIGSGTLLHSGSFNLVGTADANQSLTLSTTIGVLDIASGNSIGYVLTGTATSAVGSVSLGLQPA